MRRYILLSYFSYRFINPAFFCVIIYAQKRYSNHNHGRRRRQPLLANVNPRLPKAIHRCDGSRPFPHTINSR